MHLQKRIVLVAAVLVVCFVNCEKDRSGNASNGKTSVVFEAFSKGTPGGNYCNGFVSFSRDGKSFYADYCGRSFNIAVVDPLTTEVLNRGVQFDTWADSNEQQRMIEFIESFPDGLMLMIAIGDDAGDYHDLIHILERLGSTMIRDYRFRDSWAMIAIKGEGIALAEELNADGTVLIEVELPL